MRILAIETATTAAAVALIDGDQSTEVVASEERRHTETLLPAIEVLLDEARLEPADLDGIVVDVGPGLFTGLRVGVATARSLAMATGVPLCAVTSLEVLANDPVVAGFEHLIAVVDARRGELFAQRFDREEGRVVARGEPQVLAPADLQEEIDALPGPGALLGGGLIHYEWAIDQSMEVEMFEAVTLPSPVVAAELVGAGGLRQRAQDPATVVPLYLRDPDAIANFTVAAGVKR